MLPLDAGAASLARTSPPPVAGPDTSALVGRVRGLLAAGRPGAARPLLAALRRLDPGDPELPGLEARLKLREGNPAGACAVLDAALAGYVAGAAGVGASAGAGADPATARLLKARAEARMLADDPVGACRDAADAVVLDRHDPEAKAMLGTALIELGRPEDALPCLAEACRALPANPSIRLGLAQALERLGRAEDALDLLDEGIGLAPAHAGLRTAAILLRIKQGRREEALAAAEAARSAGVADACCFGLMGHALSMLGRHEKAASAYAEALKLAPEDPYVRHLVAASGRVAAGDRAPVEYVRTVFDGYANRFEEHLVHLGYRVPGLVRRILAACLEERRPGAGGDGILGPVLDLGCGTGLLAVVCNGLPLGPWVGVDASPNMLAGAREKGLYSELLEQDLVEFLDRDARSYPVVLAGDVFCYFGALDGALAGVARRLAPGGVFVLSLERHEEDAPARLGRTGRWSHSEAYLRQAAAAAGLRCRSVAPEELRREEDQPVQGMLAVLEHAA